MAGIESYLRIRVVMYFSEPGESMISLAPVGPGMLTALWACALGTLFVGSFPPVVLSFARQPGTATDGALYCTAAATKNMADPGPKFWLP